MVTGQRWSEMTDAEREGYLEMYGRLIAPALRGLALAGVPRG